MSDRSKPLDALRGVAISMVIARHYFGFGYGVLGVDLFFVLSGYLIGGILIDSRDEPSYFSTFYGRRVFRIMPLYLLLLAIVPPAHWGYYLVFAQAIPWLQSGFPLYEPTTVTWSLAIEEQFYLILPMLIYWLPRRWLIRVLWGGVLLAPVWRWGFWAYLPGPSFWYFLPGHLDDLFGGVLLACFMRGYCASRVLWCALACLPALCDVAFWQLVGPFPPPLSIFALLWCVLTWSAATTRRLVILHPLAWAGRRCYALYLFHIITIDLLIGRGYSRPAYLALPIVCVLAELSWRLIEAPLIGYAKRRFARANSGAVRLAVAV